MFCHGYSFYGPVPKQCDMGDRNLSLGTYLVQTTTSWKPVQTTAKRSSKFIKKITHIDDMMIYNLVKYLIQTRLRLWDIKITNNKSRSPPRDCLPLVGRAAIVPRVVRRLLGALAPSRRHSRGGLSGQGLLVCPILAGPLIAGAVSAYVCL